MTHTWHWLTLSLAAAACSESGPRIYTAQLYRADARCLEGYSALGLVEAEALGAGCAPVCLRLDGALYVSPVCSPYPARVTLETTSTGDCGAALQAFGREALCTRAASDAASDAAAAVLDAAGAAPVAIDAAAPPSAPR